MVSQRTEPDSKPRAQNKCLRDRGHHVVAALVTRAEFTKLRLTQPPLHAKDSPMAEETVWRGTSSQWKNFGLYILCALFCWLIVPIFIALARYLQTKNKVYELTTESRSPKAFSAKSPTRSSCIGSRTSRRDSHFFIARLVWRMCN